MNGGAEAFEGLREKIAAAYPALSPQLRLIAEYAMSNPDQIAVETAQNLSRRIGVPPSSMVRFAQTIGYKGFNELKRDYREHLVYRLGEITEREALIAHPSSGAIAAVDALMSETRRDLDKLFKELDRKQFDRAVIELVRADRIHVLAQHAAFGVGCIFHWTALSLGTPSNLLNGTGGFTGRQAELLGLEDVILAISFSPYQPVVIQSARAHAARGGVVVAVTDTLLSPLASFAQVTLETPQRLPFVTHSQVATACVLQALAIAVSETRPKDDQAQGAARQPA
jgi:DNA-binding MurR/RpiR family transcriptional regulator